LDVRFGLRIPPCQDPAKLGEFAAAAERAGFSTAWFPDSQFLFRDVWSTLAVVAGATDTIELGPCVTNFATRHPSVTAAAAGTTDELAPGRVILGVGTGDSSIKTLGWKPTRLHEMRANIEIVRSLLAGETATFAGRTMEIEARPRHPVPIYMAASGPRALALAGELCDGVIVLAGTAPNLIDQAIGHIRAGAERAGRELGEIDICLGTICHLTDDPLVAARIAKPHLVAEAQLGGGEALRAVGIDVEVPAVVPGVYPDMAHAVDWDHAVEVAGRWVDDEMGKRYADTFCLVGDGAYCAERIREIVARGINSLYLRDFFSYTLPENLLRTFGSEVIPRFQTASAGGQPFTS
jgi:5,10-methylenetetrahydromethanopterin reductase